MSRFPLLPPSSRTLASAGGKLHVIDRNALNAVFEKNFVTPDMIRQPEIAWWLADELRADALAVGKLSISGNQLVISLGLARVRDAKQFDGFSLNTPLTAEIQKRLNISLMDIQSSRFAEDGVNVSSMPACLQCPAPDYPRDALERNSTPTRELTVLIGADGLPKKVAVTKPEEFGFTEKAIQALQKWKFKPAIGFDGKPIAVWAPIEVTFRLY